MLNYFNYFTEIETRFGQRRGSILMLSTLDWALIETWREAGLPLEIVLRGIDQAFDKHEAQAMRAGGRRRRKINGLAWTAQAVLAAAEEAVDAATGAAPARKSAPESGFEHERIAAYLGTSASMLEAAGASPATAARLRELAAQARSPTPMHPEDLERVLTVLEEKLFASLTASAPEAELLALREQADREIAPHRAKMGAVHLKQVQTQFIHKRLLQARGLPRLSLFYMPHREGDQT